MNLICCRIDYSLIIAIFALIVSMVAIISTIRYQIINMINIQFADKAREVNSNLNSKGEIRYEVDVLSSIVSSIITARQLFNYRKKYTMFPLLTFLNAQFIIDQFYLQLHTSIREFLQNENFEKSKITTGNDSQKDTIIDQFHSSKEFLAESIKRDKSKYFDNF